MEICMRRLYLVKILSSDNDEMTYQVLILVEDKRGGSPVELNGMMNSIGTLTSSWHDKKSREVEKGRMCVVSVL